MRNKTLVPAGITAMFLLLAGCAAPLSKTSMPSSRDAVAVPAQWDAAAVPATAAPQVQPWWQEFGDPELDALVEQALQANRDLRIAAARVTQARALIDGANADRMPQLALAGGLQRGRASGADPKAAAASVGFRASWEVDLFGGKALAAQAASGDAAGAEFARQAANTTVAAEVSATYFELRALARREAVRTASVATLERQVAVVRRRFDAGTATQLDVDRLVGELGHERATAMQLAGERRVRRQQLALLLGLARAPEISGAGTAPDADVAAPPSLLPAELLERRPDVLQQARALDAAAARAGVARRDLYPRLQIDWAGSRERLSVEGASAAPRLVVGYGVSLSMPIFDGGRIRANIAVLEGQLQEAMAAYEKAMLVALADAETALAQFATASAAGVELEQAVAAGNEAERRSERLFEAGLVGLDGVLDVRRSRLRAQDALLQVRAARQVAAVGVRRAFAGAV